MATKESQTNRLKEYFTKLHILLTVCFLALRATAIPTAAQNNLPPEIREMARKVMMPLVYKVPGMDKVKVVPNLKYTSTDDPNVLMDIYLPPDMKPIEKRHAVIFIHGGAKTEYTANFEDFVDVHLFEVLSLGPALFFVSARLSMNRNHRTQLLRIPTNAASSSSEIYHLLADAETEVIAPCAVWKAIAVTVDS